MVADTRKQSSPPELDDIPGFDVLSPEESFKYFNQQARELVGMSGKEFLRRWDASEFQPVPNTADGRKIGRLVMLFPFANRAYT
jgi:hypothetical protein